MPTPTEHDRAGLCASCRHSRVVTSKRGSAFRLCERSRTDPRYPRYPPLPVLRCDGYEPVQRRPGRLDEVHEARPYSAPTSRRTGCERDEYPSHVDPETRRLVRAGTTTTGNGPGSLRTERGSPPVGSGAERQR